jgi:peptidoglycan hydrolase-like protein with peptidoglycan-binding domain
MTQPVPRRRRRGRAVAGAAVVVVAVGAATAAAVGFGGQRGGTAPAASLPPSTAQVVRQTLRDTKTVDGELGYGPTTAVTNRLAGTVTAVPGTGTVVARGQQLYKVDNRPVVLMYGAVPAYRALASGTKGDDVKQLEENLAALGYTGFTVDDEYTSATARAVEAWQASLGLDKTGRVDLGRVVFTPGPVRVDSVQAVPGQPAGAGQPVLDQTGTTRVVTVRLDVTDERLAKTGAAVHVKLPDGKLVDGTVQRVSTVIEPGGQNSDPKTQLEVIVSMADPNAGAGYDTASVQVTFTAAERKDVLTVPVAALVALSEGGYGLEVVEGTTSRYVRVDTGLFADGRVEVTGDSIQEGTTVGMPK